MFLVEDRRHGATELVFSWEDPRKDGYKGDVVEDVRLDYNMEAVHSWPDGADRPEACVGRDGNDPKQYKVFKYKRELEEAGYRLVPGMPVVIGSWSRYVKVNPDPENLEKVPEEEWYERLDEYDEGARRRRRRVQEPDAPAGGGRDEVAAWLVKKHFIVDSSIREVWYLPGGAPADEIRLVEVNDRLGGGDARPEALEFGLEVEGAKFRLCIADVTSEQLDQIQEDPSRLPAGWALPGGRVWRRGAYERTSAPVPRSSSYGS